MLYENVPGMFGRVLAGSKYGVKQARGKFGLGAKMALIWSKKSTGLPIEITTSHTNNPKKLSPDETYCKLDIDIHRNEPEIRIHEKRKSAKPYHGSSVKLVISGAWRNYKSKIVKYLRLLAVITPYAQIDLEFESEVHPQNSFTVSHQRRSDHLCKVAQEVKYHPKSVDNVIVKQLLDRTKYLTLELFLQKELYGINPDLASRLVEEMSNQTKGGISEDTSCDSLSESNIHQLTEMLRATTQFDAPSVECLSPAGEYNLNLGVNKEFSVDMVATCCSKPSAYNGHPFLIEAAVALGGKGKDKPGISVFRFANRIPLLFEAGSDVATIAANKKLKWTQYSINPKTDKISVFVSIVSTKIPFKGTGKEYIGDDIPEISEAVLKCIKECCRQLKVTVDKRNRIASNAQRSNALKKYVPNIASALCKVMDEIDNRESGRSDFHFAVNPDDELEMRHEERSVRNQEMLSEIKSIIDDRDMAMVIADSLHHVIDLAEMDQAQELVKKRGHGEASRATFFIHPLVKRSKPTQVISHPMFAMHLFHME